MNGVRLVDNVGNGAKKIFEIFKDRFRPLKQGEWPRSTIVVVYSPNLYSMVPVPILPISASFGKKII